MSALISECSKYRYWLKRDTNLKHPEKPGCLFVMLNPSTADATVDDPTIRRCIGFARRWDCASVTVANLYALRSTSPKNLWASDDPIGPDNDRWLFDLAKEYKDIVCAWGANAKFGRVNQFCRMVNNIGGARLYCLGETKSGAPRHPLYVKSDQKLIEWD